MGSVNMAAIAGRLLSFSKNAKVLVSPLKISAVPVRQYSLEVSSTGEAITHTGQVFDAQDPRRARFVGRQKEVNKNFAIKLVAEEPVTELKTEWCPVTEVEEPWVTPKSTSTWTRRLKWGHVAIVDYSSISLIITEPLSLFSF